MTYGRGRRLLQALLLALGLTAVGAGLYAVLTGTDGQRDGMATSPSVESEFRFFAAFWLSFGLLALWLAPRVERQRAALRGLALALFAAGVARAIAWIDAGRPDALYLVLLALELLIPAALVLGQRWLERRAQEPGVSGT